MKGYNQELDLIQRQIETYFSEKLDGLEKERARLEAERKKAIEALAQLRRSLSSNGLQPELGAPIQAKTLTDAVTRVIRDLIVGDFDINTVIGLVGRHHPEIKQPINPTSVSGILRSLTEDEVLELAKAGAGPKPAKYRLTEAGRESLNISNEFVLQFPK